MAGPLIHDGPATPEQISLYLDGAGLSSTATATCRYKRAADSTFTPGHPLYRIRPTLTETPLVGSVPDAFCWPIIGLETGTAYDIEVTTHDPGDVVYTNTFTTRSLPAAAGTASKTITAGSSSATIQTAFNNLVAGDVIQFQNGTYTLSSITLNVAGTSGNLIYIRGESRTGVILVDTTGKIIEFLNASYIVLENLTLRGSQVDSGVSEASRAIEFFAEASPQTQITVRNVTFDGVDTAVAMGQGNRTNGVGVKEFLFYNNTVIGNNTWLQDYYVYNGGGVPGGINLNDPTGPLNAPDGTLDILENIFWNDDGVNIAGIGNCAFQNTIKYVGDAISFAQHDSDGTLTYNYGSFAYRNEIISCGDDGTEVDHAHRNCAFYDNRLTNTATFLSLDPIYGGPFLAARNISINTVRTHFKCNSQNSGYFIYNNTLLATTKVYVESGSPQVDGIWYQADNGNQYSIGFKNNLCVYRGSGSRIIRLDNNGGYDPIEWDHNSWYPDLNFQWPSGNYANLAAAYAGLAATTPMFTGYTKRHEQDTITVSNPWTTTITLGTDWKTGVAETLYYPIVSDGDAARNTGVVIRNITDGYSGSLPDRGAVIAGRTVVSYGDQSFVTAVPIVLVLL